MKTMNSSSLKNKKKLTFFQWMDSTGLYIEDFYTNKQPRRLLKGPVEEKKTAAEWKREMKVGTKIQRQNAGCRNSVA